MYGTFNMGIGFCVCLPQTEVATATDIFEKHQIRTLEIGRVVEDQKVTVDDMTIT